MLTEVVINSFLTGKDVENSEIESFKRKFFVGPGNDDIFRQWGQTAVKLALDWLKNPEERKIHADVSLPELAKMFSDTAVPEKGGLIEDVFNECREKILNNSARMNNPRYIGHMTTAIPWFSVVVDTLISSINQNQVKIETALASSFVERQTLAWMHKLFYNFDGDFYEKAIQNEKVALGNITGGGTMGNLTALTVAREKTLPGVRRYGLNKALRARGCSEVVILASRRIHYSVKKAAAVLGLGEESVIELPVDKRNKVRIDILKNTIRALKRRNAVIMCLIGIAGTTETGNIDPLDELAEIAAQENIWFHVDAAWGGSVALCRELRATLLKGIEKADSIIVDGHKFLYLPMSHGAILFKKTTSLDKLRHNANYILRKGSVDLGVTSLEGSRRFNSLIHWFSLKTLGRSGYSLMFQKSLRLTGEFKKMIDDSPDFERTSDPEICIITYRFVPLQLRNHLKELKSRKRKRLIYKTNRKLNAINIDLQKKQREAGKSFVSRTTLESTGYRQNIVVLRAVLANLLTKSEYLEEILEEQRRIGSSLIGKYFKKTSLPASGEDA